MDKEFAKKVLEEYHSLDLENVTILTAMENLSRVAEDMADIITDFVYDE